MSIQGVAGTPVQDVVQAKEVHAGLKPEQLKKIQSFLKLNLPIALKSSAQPRAEKSRTNQSDSLLDNMQQAMSVGKVSRQTASGSRRAEKQKSASEMYRRLFGGSARHMQADAHHVIRSVLASDPKLNGHLGGETVRQTNYRTYLVLRAICENPGQFGISDRATIQKLRVRLNEIFKENEESFGRINTAYEQGLADAEVAQVELSIKDYIRLYKALTIEKTNSDLSLSGLYQSVSMSTMGLKVAEAIAFLTMSYKRLLERERKERPMALTQSRQHMIISRLRQLKLMSDIYREMQSFNEACLGLGLQDLPELDPTFEIFLKVLDKKDIAAYNTFLRSVKPVAPKPSGPARYLQSVLKLLRTDAIKQAWAMPSLNKIMVARVEDEIKSLVIRG